MELLTAIVLVPVLMGVCITIGLDYGYHRGYARGAEDQAAELAARRKAAESGERLLVAGLPMEAAERPPWPESGQTWSEISAGWQRVEREQQGWGW